MSTLIESEHCAASLSIRYVADGRLDQVRIFRADGKAFVTFVATRVQTVEWDEAARLLKVGLHFGEPSSGDAEGSLLFMMIDSIRKGRVDEIILDRSPWWFRLVPFPYFYILKKYRCQVRTATRSVSFRNTHPRYAVACAINALKEELYPLPKASDYPELLAAARKE